jgi:hypothetical protein
MEELSKKGMSFAERVASYDRYALLIGGIDLTETCERIARPLQGNQRKHEKAYKHWGVLSISTS